LRRQWRLADDVLGEILAPPSPEAGETQDEFVIVIHCLVVFVLAFELPVPVYWLVMHGPVEFWRRRKHPRAAYLWAVFIAWGGGWWFMVHFSDPLFFQPFSLGAPPVWALLAGLALIAVDVWIFSAVDTALGARRLVGQAELSGRGEMATGGLYERLRHPRYLGMIAGVLGGCLLVGSRPLWIVGGCWLILTLAIIRLEERELRRRFGPAYAAYARRVPALWPFGARLKQG
jgi:protein-S-isoprenylcysteine O-methyltransferase Ste14